MTEKDSKHSDGFDAWEDRTVCDAVREDRAAHADDAQGEQTAQDGDNTLAVDENYMRFALEQAQIAASKGEVPIGAVMVYEPIDPATRRSLAEPRIIASACNLRETTHDPAGHAEFLALQEAARVLDGWRLTDCTVYVTLEPCIMCAGLMSQARVARCVYGAHDPKAGALGTLYAIHEDERLNHCFDVTAGILEEECANLLRSFFAEKRKHVQDLEDAK